MGNNLERLERVCVVCPSHVFILPERRSYRQVELFPYSSECACPRFASISPEPFPNSPVFLESLLRAITFIFVVIQAVSYILMTGVMTRSD